MSLVFLLPRHYSNQRRNYDSKDKLFKDIWKESKHNVVRDILERLVGQEYQMKDDKQYLTALKKILEDNAVLKYAQTMDSSHRRLVFLLTHCRPSQHST